MARRRADGWILPCPQPHSLIDVDGAFAHSRHHLSSRRCSYISMSAVSRGASSVKSNAGGWPLFLISLVLVPYEFWIVLGVRLGVAEAHRSEYLEHGAALGHKYLVKTMLDDGLPVDAKGSSGT